MGCGEARREEKRRDNGWRLLEDIWGRTGERGEDAAQGHSPAPHSDSNSETRRWVIR